MASRPFTLALTLSTLPAEAASNSWTSCPDIPCLNVFGAIVKSITSRVYRDPSVAAFAATLLQDISHLNICEVNVTLSHDGEDDLVHIQTRFPLEG